MVRTGSCCHIQGDTIRPRRWCNEPKDDVSNPRLFELLVCRVLLKPDALPLPRPASGQLAGR